jgi:hypothetical protein
VNFQIGQTETYASTTLKEGLRLKLGNSGQQALHIVLWTAANKCRGGIRVLPILLFILNDHHTSYDWPTGFLPAYQRNEHKNTQIEQGRGKKMTPNRNAHTTGGIQTYISSLDFLVLAICMR